MIDNKGFRLLSVEIEGFRGYEKKVEFIFPTDKRFFLFTGSNGYGKTTFFDAVEWAFTGKIERIIENIEIKKDKRNPSEQTIINNINNERNKVLANVKLKFYLDKEQYEIKRKSIEYKKDYLEENTRIYLIRKQEEIEKDNQWINSLFRDESLKTYDFVEKFASYHLSSHEKNLRILQKNREGIHSMLSILFGENKFDTYRDNIKYIVEKTRERYEAKNNEYISFFKKSKAILDQDYSIDNINYYINKYNENLILHENQLGYVEVINGELANRYQLLNEIANLKKNEDNYKNYKIYIKAKDKEKSYLLFVKNIENRFSDVKNLLYYVRNGFQTLEEKQNKLIDVKLRFNKLLTDIKENKYKNGQLAILDYLKYEMNYETKKIEADFSTDFSKTLMEREINKERIELISKNKSAYKTENDNLINLIYYAEKHIERVNEIESCPLCKQQVNLMKLKEVIKQSQELFSKWDSEIAELTDKQKKLSRKIEEMKTKLNTEIEEVLSFIECEINKCLEIIRKKNEIQKFRIDCERYGISMGDLNEEVIKREKRRMQEEMELALREVDYEKISLEEIEVREFISRYEPSYIKYAHVLPSIDSEILNKKISYLDKIQGNTTYLTIKKQMEDLKEERDILQKKLDVIKKIRTKINNAINELEETYKNDLEEPINYVYKKINRHSNFSGINISLLNKGVNKKADTTVGDVENSVNLSNILSSGQITTVALSFFLGIAFKQNFSRFRAYFFDDPIQHMDDLNVLSFVDLLRVHLSDYNFANQIFLSTCNEDIEGLFVSKMKHFNVGITKYIFKNYSEYHVVNY
ncbi:AAA family ATPase [Aneurinibacillus sp. REN35]|uniref:AAA family ATPase n=2 Tax=Paenibacillaceae TaxID=186822 RepID=UPI0035282059